MSFQPLVPMPGVAGWRFLQRTAPAQQATFEKGAALTREIAYFTENIGGVTSASDLVADRRLLKVALGAFGLEGEIDKKALVRKVLEEGTTDPRAFATRLSDPAWRKFSAAFGFGDLSGARTGDPGFAGRITSLYKTRTFEVAVGETSNDMRLAMTFRREMAELSKGETGSSWFSVLGSKPLRAVMEKAFNLPPAFSQLDLDRQRDVMREKTSAMFGDGNLSAFADPANTGKIIDRFLALSQLEGGASLSGPESGALILLQTTSAAAASQGIMNLLSSRG